MGQADGCHHCCPWRTWAGCADDRQHDCAGPPTSYRPKKQSGDYHIGRSRGGLTTKLHLRVNGHGLPLQLELSAGEAHDAPMAANLLSDLPEGTSVLADRGYYANWIRGIDLPTQIHACYSAKYQTDATSSITTNASTKNAISLNAASTNSNNSAKLQPDMIDTPQHTWPSQNSPLSDFGYDFMSPQPSAGPYPWRSSNDVPGDACPLS